MWDSNTTQNFQLHTGYCKCLDFWHHKNKKVEFNILMNPNHWAGE